MSVPKKSKHTFGLGHGFAKALKIGVDRSIKKRHLEQTKEPAWWPKLEEKKT